MYWLVKIGPVLDALSMAGICGIGGLAIQFGRETDKEDAKARIFWLLAGSSIGFIVWLIIYLWGGQIS